MSKYNYYFLGVSGAIFAYVVKELEPVRLGLNPHTISVFGIYYLGCSIVLGLYSFAHTLSGKLCVETLNEIRTALADIEARKESASTEDARSKFEEAAKITFQMSQTYDKELQKQMDFLKATSAVQWVAFLLSLFTFALSKILQPYLN